jgi:hypothetical protein
MPRRPVDARRSAQEIAHPGFSSKASIGQEAGSARECDRLAIDVVSGLILGRYHRDLQIGLALAPGVDDVLSFVV